MFEEFFIGATFRFICIGLLYIFLEQLGFKAKFAAKRYTWLAVMFIAMYPFGWTLLDMGFTATLGFFVMELCDKRLWTFFKKKDKPSRFSMAAAVERRHERNNAFLINTLKDL